MIEKGELERAKNLARELITKYPKSEARWLTMIKKINDKIALEKSKKNDDNPTTTVTSSVDKKTHQYKQKKVPKTRLHHQKRLKMIQKPKASLQKILEMSEEEFETYAKTIIK